MRRAVSVLTAIIVAITLAPSASADAWSQNEPVRWATAIVDKVYGYEAAHSAWDLSGFGAPRIISRHAADIPFVTPLGAHASGTIRLRGFTGSSARYVVATATGSRRGRMTRRQLARYLTAGGEPRRR